MALAKLVKALKSDALNHVKQNFHDYFEQAEQDVLAVVQKLAAGKPIDDISSDIREFALLPYWTEHGIEGLSSAVHDVLKLARGLGFLPKTILSDVGGLLKQLIDAPYVSSNGSIWGTKPFEQVNLGWAYAPLNNLLTLVHGKAPFQTSPVIHTVESSFSMAILGDWGTGFENSGLQLPAKNVYSAARTKNPTYMMHLGDVYYTGQPKESVKVYLPPTLHPSELARFVDPWSKSEEFGPPPPSFTLNSNHEMYCGAWGYFDNALTEPAFSTQRDCSYFALKNDDWLILCLDSAYVATNLYQNGQLNSQQIAWAQEVVAEAGSRKLIVITHHTGTNFDGSQTNRLWDNVIEALNGRAPDYWYWGHVHNGVVYRPRQSTSSDGTTVTTRARCVGHGAIPFGDAKLSGVEYYAHTPTNNPDFPKTVRNGFALLRFNGPDLVEEFYEEDSQNGVLAWSSRS